VVSDNIPIYYFVHSAMINIIPPCGLFVKL
jgi:hypothetical protein